MNDKIKEFRDKNPLLDFVAGFIPYVGEAQDAQDLYHATKKGDIMQAGLSSLGLLLPGLTGNQIKKFVGVLGDLNPAWKAKGWKLADDGESFISPQGVSFMKNSEGKLMSEESLANEIKAKTAQKKILKEKTTAKSNIKKFDEEAYNFAEETGFYFDTKSWQAGIPKHMQLTPKQLQDYVTKTGPAIMDHLKVLIKNGKEANPKTYALRGKKGQWEAYFPESLPLKGKYGEQYKAGWRPVSNQEAELYLIQTSPNAAGKFDITGITMHRGVKEEALDDFKKGAPQQWYSSNVANSPTYSGPRGLRFFGAPVKTDKTNIKAITNSRANPHSNSWHSEGQDPIGQYIDGNSHSINISEVPLVDDMSKLKGFYTVLGNDVQVKALKGGTGWFDLSNPNPLRQLSMPLGIGSIIGLKAFNKDNERKDKD